MTPPALPRCYPVDLRLPFLGAEGLMRLAQTCSWVRGHAALVHGAGPGNLGLVLGLSTLGLAVTVADASAAQLETFKGAAGARASGVELLPLDAPLQLPEGRFDVVFVDGRFGPSLESVAASVRPALRRNGHLVAVCASRVGRGPPSGALGEYWERRTGTALRPPRELLQRLERTGYEPQSVESLSDDGMGDAYQLLSAALPLLDPAALVPFDAEVKAWRAAGPASVTLAFSLVVGRRKEPGEKPPAVRTAG